MSHVTHVSGSCDTHVSETCHTYHRGTWHIWLRHITLVDQVMSHMWVGPVTHEWGVSHMCGSHVLALLNDNQKLQDHRRECCRNHWKCSRNFWFATTGPISVHALTHSYVCHDLLTWMLKKLRSVNTGFHLRVWHDLFTCVTWPIHMYDITHQVWHASLTWMSEMSEVLSCSSRSHSCVWHGACICATWLIMCDMPHSNECSRKYWVPKLGLVSSYVLSRVYAQCILISDSKGVCTKWH